MATALTQVTNQTANPLPMPYPYKGIVYGGAVQVALLADTPANVVANLGGVNAIKGIWNVGPVPLGSTFSTTYHDQSTPSPTGAPTSAVNNLSTGAVLVSATTIAPTAAIHHVSGTAAIVNITVPTGTVAGATVILIPDGIFTWTAAGNIGLAGTAVVGKALAMVWDGATKWYPSYIA